MTGDATATERFVDEPATNASASKDRTARVALIGLVLCLAVAAVYFGPRVLQQGDEIAALSSQSDKNRAAADRNAADGQQLAAQLRALGATPVVEPAKPAELPKTGAAGVGIARVESGDCSIRITLTDGRVSTLTNLCGAPGAPAPPARGIAAVDQQGCFVAVSYTDATSTTLGPFCGAPGTDGRSPACLDEPTQCRGPAGESPPCLSEPSQCRGPQGAGVAELRFVRVDDGSCVSRVTYADPATGQTRTDDTPAGDSACPAELPPGTDPPTPTN